VAHILITANSRHFLRVNAQMHKLDKQKTHANSPSVITNKGGLTFLQTKRLRMKNMFFLFLPLLLTCCSGGQYKLYDMAFDNYVTVDDLIESGEYIPHFCGQQLDRIIKTNPPTINPKLSGQLNKLLDKWATEEEKFRLTKYDSTKFSHSSDNIIKNTKYAYTYFLSEEPMHVFSTCIPVTHSKEMNFATLYIRIDNKDEIAGDYTIDGIIMNNCDVKIKCPDL